LKNQQKKLLFFSHDENLKQNKPKKKIPSLRRLASGFEFLRGPQIISVGLSIAQKEGQRFPKKNAKNDYNDINSFINN